MIQNNQVEHEEGCIKSEFQETLQLLEERKNFFIINQISNESQMLQCSGYMIRTAAQLFPGMAGYMLTQSPVQPTLRDLYTSHFDKQKPRCVLPPPSQGQESVNQTLSFDPTFKWLQESIIDSTMLQIDQPQPKKVQKDKIPSGWQKLKEILVYDIHKKIHIKSEVKSLDDYFKSIFDRFRNVRLSKIKYVYYKGKPSIILRFHDQKGSSFIYFNLCTQRHRKQILGQNSQIFRITQNRLKNAAQQKSVYVMFRNLPTILNKQSFVEILKKRKLNPIWMEELIQIENQKYTLCKVQYLQNAFQICTEFHINPPYKGIKVNLHPKSSKTWESKTNQDFTMP